MAPGALMKFMGREAGGLTEEELENFKRCDFQG